jgi:hypothetical protein
LETPTVECLDQEFFNSNDSARTKIIPKPNLSKATFPNSPIELEIGDLANVPIVSVHKSHERADRAYGRQFRFRRPDLIHKFLVGLELAPARTGRADCIGLGAGRRRHFLVAQGIVGVRHDCIGAIVIVFGLSHFWKQNDPTI